MLGVTVRAVILALWKWRQGFLGLDSQSSLIVSCRLRRDLFSKEVDSIPENDI